MATAPTPGGPGTSTSVEKVEAATQVMRITIRGYPPVTIAPGNVSLAEKMAVQKATGMSFESFYSDDSQIGEVSASVLWWLARRATGEPFLTFTQVEKDWPSPMTEDDIEVELVEGGTDPEA